MAKRKKSGKSGYRRPARKSAPRKARKTTRRVRRGGGSKKTVRVVIQSPAVTPAGYPPLVGARRKVF